MAQGLLKPPFLGAILEGIGVFVNSKKGGEAEPQTSRRKENVVIGRVWRNFSRRAERSMV